MTATVPTRRTRPPTAGHSSVRQIPESRATTPDVSVVIVHYRTPRLLERCLDSLRRSEGPSLEVFVIDNASPQFEPDDYSGILPDARIIRNPTNVGFAVASNQGLRAARGSYLLLLNPDAFVNPDSIRLMAEYLDAHPDVGCVTCRVELENGDLDPACRRMFPTPERALYRMTLLSRLFPRSRRFGQYNLTYLDEWQETEIDQPCGAFLMLRREIREEVGLLDERYFLYGEDTDWAFRIKQAGWRIMYVPTATATHTKRASSRKCRADSIRHFYRAMRTFYDDYYRETYPPPVTAAVMLAITIRERVELMAVGVGRLRRRWAPATHRAFLALIR